MAQKKIIKINKTNTTYRTPPKNLRKKLKKFSFNFSLFIIVMSVFYFASPLSRLSVIFFNELEFISRARLIELTGIEENAFFPALNLREIENRLEEHALVESATVGRRGLNSLTIEIVEQKIIGCVDIQGELRYVLRDGQTMKEEDGVTIQCRGIVIHGLSEEEVENSVLSLFVSALSEVNPVFISLIEEVHYEPRFGDINRFSLLLKDGNTVKVNSYSMVHNLAAYQTMVESVAARLGEGVTGIFNLDVGGFFQPYGTNDTSGGPEIDITEDLEDFNEVDLQGNILDEGSAEDSGDNSNLEAEGVLEESEEGAEE